MISSILLGFFADSLFQFPIKFVPNYIKHTTKVFTDSLFQFPIKFVPNDIKHTTRIYLQTVCFISLSNFSEMISSLLLGFLQTVYFISLSDLSKTYQAYYQTIRDRNQFKQIIFHPLEFCFFEVLISYILAGRPRGLWLRQAPSLVKNGSNIICISLKNKHFLF